MNNENFVADLYVAVDNMDTGKLVRAMTGDGIFRFANMPEVVGKENITAFLDGFFQSIKGLHHTELESWNDGNVRIVTGNVTYTRHDDSTLKVPFSVILKMKEDLINEWLIFSDNSQLYN